MSNRRTPCPKCKKGFLYAFQIHTQSLTDEIPYGNFTVPGKKCCNKCFTVFNYKVEISEA